MERTAQTSCYPTVTWQGATRNTTQKGEALCFLCICVVSCFRCKFQCFMLKKRHFLDGGDAEGCVQFPVVDCSVRKVMSRIKTHCSCLQPLCRGFQSGTFCMFLLEWERFTANHALKVQQQIRNYCAAGGFTFYSESSVCHLQEVERIF